MPRLIERFRRRAKSLSVPGTRPAIQADNARPDSNEDGITNTTVHEPEHAQEPVTSSDTDTSIPPVPNPIERRIHPNLNELAEAQRPATPTPVRNGRGGQQVGLSPRTRSRRHSVPARSETPERMRKMSGPSFGIVGGEVEEGLNEGEGDEAGKPDVDAKPEAEMEKDKSALEVPGETAETHTRTRTPSAERVVDEPNPNQTTPTGMSRTWQLFNKITSLGYATSLSPSTSAPAALSHPNTTRDASLEPEAEAGPSRTSTPAGTKREWSTFGRRRTTSGRNTKKSPSAFWNPSNSASRRNSASTSRSRTRTTTPNGGSNASSLSRAYSKVQANTPKSVVGVGESELQQQSQHTVDLGSETLTSTSTPTQTQRRPLIDTSRSTPAPAESPSSPSANTFGNPTPPSAASYKFTFGSRNLQSPYRAAEEGGGGGGGGGGLPPMPPLDHPAFLLGNSNGVAGGRRGRLGHARSRPVMRAHGRKRSRGMGTKGVRGSASMPAMTSSGSASRRTNEFGFGFNMGSGSSRTRSRTGSTKSSAGGSRSRRSSAEYSAKQASLVAGEEGGVPWEAEVARELVGLSLARGTHSGNARPGPSVDLSDFPTVGSGSSAQAQASVSPVHAFGSTTSPFGANTKSNAYSSASRVHDNSGADVVTTNSGIGNANREVDPSPSSDKGEAARLGSPIVLAQPEQQQQQDTHLSVPPTTFTTENEERERDMSHRDKGKGKARANAKDIPSSYSSASRPPVLAPIPSVSTAEGRASQDSVDLAASTAAVTREREPSTPARRLAEHVRRSGSGSLGDDVGDVGTPANGKGKRKADEVDGSPNSGSAGGTPPDEKRKEQQRATFAPDTRPTRPSAGSGSLSHAPSSYHRQKRARLSQPPPGSGSGAGAGGGEERPEQRQQNSSVYDSWSSRRSGANPAHGHHGSISRASSSAAAHHHQNQNLPQRSESRRSVRSLSLSHQSIPISALISPHAPSVSAHGAGSMYHMRDPRKPARVQPTGWGLSWPNRPPEFMVPPPPTTPMSPAETNGHGAAASEGDAERKTKGNGHGHKREESGATLLLSYLRPRPRRSSNGSTKGWFAGWHEHGGSPVHAWMFFIGFVLFPVWWVAGFCVGVPRTRRMDASGGIASGAGTKGKGGGKGRGKGKTREKGDVEKGHGQAQGSMLLDDPQVEHDARSWRTRCRIMAGVSLVTYVPFIVLVAVFVSRR